jgi:hypothetical protein
MSFHHLHCSLELFKNHSFLAVACGPLLAFLFVTPTIASSM